MSLLKTIPLSLFLILFVANNAFTQGYAEKNINESESATRAYPFHRFITHGTIRAYQKIISPTKGTPCPMHPHCSLYGYQVFKRYNPLRAFAMTADRMHRCGHDLENYEIVEVNQFAKFYDPVDPVFTNSMLKPNVNSWFEKHNFISLNIVENSNISMSIPPEERTSEDGRLFNFAEKLQLEGDFNRAITEYRRLISYFPNSPYQKQAYKAVFSCYYRSEQYLMAIHWGIPLLTKDIIDLADEVELKFYIGASYFKLKNYRLARTYLKEEMPSTVDGNFKEKSLLLHGLSYAMEVNWAKAEKSFASLSSDSKFAKNANKCQKLSLEGQRLRLKKPVVAGILGIVPGLGYLYDGYKQTALSSFIVNTLFIWSTVEAFRRDNQSLGVMLSILSFGWYTGNIYGSIISSQRKNIKLKNDLLYKFNIGFLF